MNHPPADRQPISRLMSTVNRWGIPLGLLGLCLVMYGPLTPFLGLYWDDWPSLWFLRFFGPGIFPAAFAIDRPVQGWLFVPTTALLGESMLAWQAFGILARWLSGMALLWLLYLLWPRHKTQAVWVVTLFLIYPGFLQQYVPITYSHQFLIQASYFLGLGLMVQAIRKPASYWPLTGLSILVSLLSMFALEYFYGLVLLRPVLIWLALQEYGPVTAESLDRQGTPKPARRFIHLLSLWLPYLLADLLFLAWRLTHSTPRGAITLFDQLAASPVAALLALGQVILSDLYESSLLAWTRTLAYLNTSGMKPLLAAGYWASMFAAGLLTFLLLFYHLRRTAAVPPAWSPTDESPGHTPIQPPATTQPPAENTQTGSATRSTRRWGLQTALLGAYTLLISGWPIWVTNLHIELAFPWDRFTLLLMLGASLLLLGLLEWLVRPRLLQILLIALLAGLASGAQFREALLYRLEWMTQKDFFWQLAWRAPALQPGTLVLYPNSQFERVTDNSLTAPLNWLYAPEVDAGASRSSDPATRQMPYLMYDPLGRLGNKLPELKPGLPIKQNYRATEFNGSTSQAIALFYDPPRCLKVLDPAKDTNLPNKPGIVLEILPLSQPERILAARASQTASVLAELFGQEPEHGWCYYFESAELAVQRGDWQAAAALGDQVLRLKGQPGREQAAELAPYIEGYAHVGRWADAVQLSQAAVKASDKMPAMLCDLWYSISQSAPVTPESQAAVEQIRQKYECEFP